MIVFEKAYSAMDGGQGHTTEKCQLFKNNQTELYVIPGNWMTRENVHV